MYLSFLDYITDCGNLNLRTFYRVYGALMGLTYLNGASAPSWTPLGWFWSFPVLHAHCAISSLQSKRIFVS